MRRNLNILWIDDEIEVLKPHILFLEQRGYQVTAVSNGEDALRLIREKNFAAVLLDEKMPGRSGLSILPEIKTLDPHLAVIMVTKSEEEKLVEEALKRKIDDYILKPVNPRQILASLKRILVLPQLEKQKLISTYTENFRLVKEQKEKCHHWQDWINLYLKLISLEKDLEEIQDTLLTELLEAEIKECNFFFAQYIEENYPRWLNEGASPLLSPDLVNQYLVPSLKKERPLFLVIFDCLRADQWLSIVELLSYFYQIETNYYYSILPTVTPYTRNSLLSGLFPDEIARRYLSFWQKIFAKEEESRIEGEKKLIVDQLERLGFSLPVELFKITAYDQIFFFENRLANLKDIPLVVVIFNFIDLLTHQRSRDEILKELAPNDRSFRELTLAWFSHSRVREFFKQIAHRFPESLVVVTSDHGSILANEGIKLYGRIEPSTGLRYKVGRNLSCHPQWGITIKTPSLYKLPDLGEEMYYVLAKRDGFFTGPVNFERYTSFLKGGFQHGGVSMQEIILPCALLRPKR